MQTYQSWKQEPFTLNQDKDRLAFEIASLISDLTKFYGLVGLQPEETEAILNFIFQYFKNFQRFKVCDMIRAVELYKKRPELNKLCPEYFETMFDNYRKSQERKDILKQFELETENRVPEKTEKTAAQRLIECKAEFDISGEIRLQGNKTYDQNFKLILEHLGADTMNELKLQAKEILIQEWQDSKLSTKISEHYAIDRLIKNFYDSEGKENYKNFPEWIVKTRQLHLQRLFEMVNNGFVEIEFLTPTKQTV